MQLLFCEQTLHCFRKRFWFAWSNHQAKLSRRQFFSEILVVGNYDRDSMAYGPRKYSARRDVVRVREDHEPCLFKQFVGKCVVDRAQKVNLLTQPESKGSVSEF